MVSRGPRSTIIARSTTLRSSRMLPGHGYRCSAAMFSRGDRVDPLAERRRELVDEAPHQQRDVLDALAQRRHVDREDVQPVEQVLAERCPRAIALLEVAVRGGDDRAFDGDRRRAAEPLDLPLFEHAQQLDLDVERQLADLVEEDRRVVGQLEAADLPRERAGERALLAAEQLALDQRRRDRRAVDADHRPAAPRAALVDLRGEQLLAGAGLAEQQHRRIGGRDLLALP